METGHERCELFFDSLLDAPFGDKPDQCQYILLGEKSIYSLNPFLLVLISHIDLASAWLEIDGDLFTKHFIFDRKCLEDDIVNVIVADTSLVILYIIG